jgi:hypothetical protein
LKKQIRAFSFVQDKKSLSEVLTDHDLASLGDAFVNFVYSLALSNKKGRPTGKKTKGTLLAEALRRAGLRSFIPSSVSSHALADAAEALLVYAWLHGCTTLEESVTILEKNDDPVEGFAQLLEKIKSGIKLS